MKRYPIGAIVKGNSGHIYKVLDNSKQVGSQPLYKVEVIQSLTDPTQNGNYKKGDRLEAFHRFLQLYGRQSSTNVQSMVMEAIDEVGLLEHLLEDLTEALVGAVRDVKTIKQLSPEQSDIDKLKKECQNVMVALERLST